jgi:mannose-6-phosphate isomerase-like protein (cupin superfamily)
MFSLKRPYLVIPLLIEQPTWGGDYILKKKKWDSVPSMIARKIGQSYELFGNSKLLTKITDSSNPDFAGELGNADGTIKQELPLTEDEDFVMLKNMIPNMKLLIKFTQAAGNSFQMHIKPGTSHERWKPKPESWYYFEDGLISCGIKAGADIYRYKQVCLEIEALMKDLSAKVKNSDTPIDEALIHAKQKIQELNPWQFVNILEAKKGDLIDLSEGGIHHSWEEDRKKFPQGNVVYEVQVDVMDPFCTIRSFDQGKMKEDGSIREIHVEDYFRYIDTTAAHNDIKSMMRTRKEDNLLTTPYYSLDIIELTGRIPKDISHSFHHLFVKSGSIRVECGDGTVMVGEGHSCIVPGQAGTYTLTSRTPQSIILKTYIANT